jgi:DNA-directed RNA polymerase specialized sigma24 family protein
MCSSTCSEDFLLDAALLAAAQAGDARALASVPHKFGGIYIEGRLVRSGLMWRAARDACRRVGLDATCNETVREVAAETYSRLFRPDLTRFDGQKSTAGQYVYGQALNAARSVRRAWYDPIETFHDKPADNDEEQALDLRHTSNAELLDVIPDTAPTPAEVCVAERSLAQITSIAPQPVAIAILMSYLADQSISDTAAELSMCRTTLMRQLDRFGKRYRALDLAA